MSLTPNAPELNPPVTADKDDGVRAMTRADRRKLQNRVNQRRSRQKRARVCQEAQGSHSIRRWVIYTDPQLSGAQAQRTHPDDLLTCPAKRAEAKEAYFCQLNPSERSAYLSSLRHRAISGAVRNALRCDLLLSVTQYNIIVAMGVNADLIGLTMESLRQDIPSPISMASLSSLPPSLQPTRHQIDIPHHPWIDLCPIPSIRDTLLLHEGRYDDEELCHDLFSGCDQQPGMLVWGEAWDPSAYEISEALFNKWRWLFGNWHGAIQSSNHWRRKRGEAPLRLEALSLEETIRS